MATFSVSYSSLQSSIFASHPDPTLAVGVNPDPARHGNAGYGGHLREYVSETLPSTVPRASQPNETVDWEDFDFGLGEGDPAQGQVDPDFQALLDTILQPHLHVGIGEYDPGFALPPL
jgi:hypothetical protein